MPVLELHIAPAIEDITPRLKLFFEAMLYKLARNTHKGRWEDMDLESSMKRLGEELNELVESIGTGNNVEILMEAADVANFAMIIADIATDKPEMRNDT